MSYKPSMPGGAYEAIGGAMTRVMVDDAILNAHRKLSSLEGLTDYDHFARGIVELKEIYDELGEFSRNHSGAQLARHAIRSNALRELMIDLDEV
jgi:hypothetical protein